jgi:hypothetical protein
MAIVNAFKKAENILNTIQVGDNEYNIESTDVYDNIYYRDDSGKLQIDPANPKSSNYRIGSEK